MGRNQFEANTTYNISDKVTRREFLHSSLAVAGALFVPQELLASERSTENKGNDPLTQASLSYISIPNSPKDADRIARFVMCMPGASASNMCGPLAASIGLGWRLNPDGSITSLADDSTAGLRIEGIAPNDMWLGSPENDPNRYHIAFPPDEYNRYHIQKSIGNVDFNDIEGAGILRPGDFIYLDGGSFTHYITISRMDSAGRLYCVSNVHSTKKGEFDTRELMLWDPNTRDGFFRDWANGVGPQRARTGLKGFYLWRREKELPPILQDYNSKEIRNTMINRFRKETALSCNAEVFEFGKGLISEWRNRVPFYDYVGLSLPVSMIALRKIQEEHGEEIKRKGLRYVLEHTYVEGVSIDRHIVSAINDQQEASIKSLIRFTGAQERLESIGMRETNLSSFMTTEKDMYSCWETLLCSEYIGKESARYLLDHLRLEDGGWGIKSKHVNGLRRSRVLSLQNGRYVYAGMNINLRQNNKTETDIESMYNELINMLK